MDDDAAAISASTVGHVRVRRRRAGHTVLGIWAHPDDEAYLSGELMAVARDNGQRVVCLMATPRRARHARTTDLAAGPRWPPSAPRSFDRWQRGRLGQMSVRPEATREATRSQRFRREAICGAKS